MMMEEFNMRWKAFWLLLSGFLVFNSSLELIEPVALFAAEAPSVELALRFRPVQKDVEFETPNSTDYNKCQVKIEKRSRGSGWVVIGTAHQVLRRYIDTNGDNVVDQWRLFQTRIGSLSRR